MPLGIVIGLSEPLRRALDVTVDMLQPFRHIATGLRVSLPIMLILVMISEMVGSTDGIGYFILEAQCRFRVAQMYAAMLALAMLGYILNQILNLVQRSLLTWHDGLTKHPE